MNLVTGLLVVLVVLLLVGGLPQVSGNFHGFGWGPSGLGLLLLIILLIVLLRG